MTASMSEHTKEPWAGKEIPLTAVGLARAGFSIVFTNHPATRDEAEANARRIVASVNACAGIPTDVLEAMPSGPSAPKLSDERILEIAGKFQYGGTFSWDSNMAEKEQLEFARAIERELLGE